MYIGRGDQIAEMLMKTKCPCPNCGKTVVFESGAQKAKSFNITQNVVMCSGCNHVYEVYLAPNVLRLTKDVTDRYPQVEPKTVQPKPAPRPAAPQPKSSYAAQQSNTAGQEVPVPTKPNGKRKYGKLLSSHPGIYLGIFIYLAMGGLTCLIMGLSSNQLGNGNASGKVIVLIYALTLCFFGGRGIYKYIQHRNDPELNAAKNGASSVSYAAPAPAASAPAASAPAASAPAEKRSNILIRYRSARDYLDSCGEFDEAKLRETNRIAGNVLSEADIQKMLSQSRMIIGGMGEIKNILRNTLSEGIDAFEKIEAAGVDLNKYEDKSSGASSAPSHTAEIRKLVDEIAHYSSLSIDRSEEEEMGKKLLAYGDEAVPIIEEYLISCARGAQSTYWWSDAAYLVRLLPQFPGADCERIFNRLISQQTNIWEYHTQIKDVAQQELLKLKKAAPEYDASVISDQDAEAELKLVYNTYGFTAEDRIKRAIEMQPSVESWSDKNKAFYYYIIGDALKRRDSNDERRFAFYAAQVFYQPVNTSLGWVELSRDLKGHGEIHPSPEEAQRLHRELPLPDSLEELL